MVVRNPDPETGVISLFDPEFARFNRGRDLFDKDRAFRRATIFPAGEDDIGFQARARICKLFEERIGHRMDREDHAIADAVAQHFPQLAHKLRHAANATIDVKEWRDEIVFLHKVVPGAADRSYGIQVAKLAGLPPAVVARASDVLGRLRRAASTGRPRIWWTTCRCSAPPAPVRNVRRRRPSPRP